MKRFITAAGAAVMALSCLTAAPVSADSRKDLIWQSAYQKVLTTYSRMQGFDGGKTKDSSGARWDLYDIDGDNMPELFISPDNSHAYGVMIYTCVDGEPKLLQAGEDQAFGEFGLCAVSTDKHMLGSFHTGMGIVSRTMYKLEGGTLKKLDSFMNDAEAHLEDQRDKTVWQHNDEQVTAAQYYAAYDPYASILWKEDVGRTYAFSDRSPLSSELRKVQAAAPPDVNTALVGGSAAALFVALIAALISIISRREKRHRH